METNKSLFWNKAMLWGFITALGIMIVTSAYYATDNYFASSRSWVELAVYIAGIVLCALSFKATLGDNDEFPYARALGLGVATLFFASLIIALFTFVFFKYIDPGMIDEILRNTEEVALSKGVPEEMIEQQIAMQEKFIQPAILAASTIFSTVLYGLIISLLTSIFLKKKSAGGYNAAMNEIKDEE